MSIAIFRFQEFESPKMDITQYNTTVMYNLTRRNNYTQDIVMEENGLMDLLHAYLAPIIAILGMIGNLLSIFVFLLTYLNRQTSSVYLAYMAFADSLYLFCYFIGWFSYIGYHPFHQQGWCQIIIYFTYVSAFLSVWTVASFTIERYIVVFHPLQRHIYCTRRRSIMVILSLGVFALLFYSFALVFNRVIMNEDYGMFVCTPITEYYNISRILTSVDTVITLIIPSVIIIIFNTAIACRVHMFTSRLSMDPERPSSDTSSEPDNSDRKSSSRWRSSDANHLHVYPRSNQRPSLRLRAQMKTTRALLAISSIFILLNLPAHAFKIHAFIMNNIKHEPAVMSRNAIQIQALAQFLYQVNFAVDFILYSAWSGNFRRALAQSVRKIGSNLTKSKRGMCQRTRRNTNQTEAHYRITSSRKRGSNKIQFKIILSSK